MTKRLPYITISYIMALLLCACDDERYINDGIEPELVVEGWITAGKFPIVIVSTTVPVDKYAHDTEELQEHVQNWARVAIHDGQQEIVLTGMYDEHYMPPYIYTTTDIRGEVGKTYTLTVSVDNYHATATTTIPEGVELQGIVTERKEYNDSTRQLYALFNDPAEKNYYTLFYKLGAHERQANLCKFGVFDDSSFNNSVKYPVYKNVNLTEDVNAPTEFVVGDTVCVSLSTIDKQSHDFWYDYQNTAAFSGNFFTPYTQNIRSNIKGGHGYWCGYSTSEKWIIIDQ